MSIYLGSSEPSKIYVGSNEVSAVYVGTEKVRPSGWKPGANTLAYFPLAEDGLDKTGNYTLSNTGTSQTLGRTFTSSCSLSAIPSTAKTVLAYVKINTFGPTYSGNAVQFSRILKGNSCFSISGQGLSQAPCFRCYNNGSSYYGGTNLASAGQWNLICLTKEESGSNVTLCGYINGTKYQFFSGTWSVNPETSVIFTEKSGISFSITLSELIIEDKTWTQAEIQDYYNKSKGYYGL